MRDIRLIVSSTAYSAQEPASFSSVVFVAALPGGGRMTETAERNYKVVQAKDGTYAVQVTQHENNAPLTISGFKSEDEARAWIEAEQNKSGE
jgi:hypothetical protein